MIDIVLSICGLKRYGPCGDVPTENERKTEGSDGNGKGERKKNMTYSSWMEFLNRQIRRIEKYLLVAYRKLRTQMEKSRLISSID